MVYATDANAVCDFNFNKALITIRPAPGVLNDPVGNGLHGIGEPARCRLFRAGVPPFGDLATLLFNDTVSFSISVSRTSINLDCTLCFIEADDDDSVGQSGAALIFKSDDTAFVELEGSPASIQCNSEWLLQDCFFNFLNVPLKLRPFLDLSNDFVRIVLAVTLLSA